MSDSEEILDFVHWLESNGAKYPKIRWPSTATVSGIRGAIAIDDIKTNEYMVQIPIKLMMSPLHAYVDERIGSYLKKNRDILFGDSLLATFIMEEIRKGKESFYHPFLKIMSIPDNITKWEQSELVMLQDESLSKKAESRIEYIEKIYNETIRELCAREPDIFPASEFSKERFEFAWYSIQSRAFGRRLPWTALVPFADCLNHANVATKYDYDVDGNGLFRLFPTNQNKYVKGAEVFNSYGRRANDNLLLEYGFCILDNEWDEVWVDLLQPEPKSPPAALSAPPILSEPGCTGVDHPPPPPSTGCIDIPAPTEPTVRLESPPAALPQVARHSTGKVTRRELLPLRALSVCRNALSAAAEGGQGARPRRNYFSRSFANGDSSLRRQLESMSVSTDPAESAGMVRETREALDLLQRSLVAWQLSCDSSLEEDERLHADSIQWRPGRGHVAGASDPSEGKDCNGRLRSALLYRLTRKRTVRLALLCVRSVIEAVQRAVECPHSLNVEEAARLCHSRLTNLHSTARSEGDTPHAEECEYAANFLKGLFRAIASQNGASATALII